MDMFITTLAGIAMIALAFYQGYCRGHRKGVDRVLTDMAAGVIEPIMLPLQTGSVPMTAKDMEEFLDYVKEEVKKTAIKELDDDKSK